MNPADLDDDDYAAMKATDRVSGPKADAFARALDLLGWMIVQQPQFEDGGRWPIDGPGPCPSRAESLAKPPRPALRLIEGGKDEAP